MSSNDIKTNPKDRNGAHHHKQTGKRSSLLSFAIFTAWVIIISLLLPLIDNLPNNPETIVLFAIKEGN